MGVAIAARACIARESGGNIVGAGLCHAAEDEVFAARLRLWKEVRASLAAPAALRRECFQIFDRACKKLDAELQRSRPINQLPVATVQALTAQMLRKLDCDNKNVVSQVQLSLEALCSVGLENVGKDTFAEFTHDTLRMVEADLLGRLGGGRLAYDADLLNISVDEGEAADTRRVFKSSVTRPSSAPPALGRDRAGRIDVQHVRGATTRPWWVKRSHAKLRRLQSLARSNGSCPRLRLPKSPSSSVEQGFYECLQKLHLEPSWPQRPQSWHEGLESLVDAFECADGVYPGDSVSNRGIQTHRNLQGENLAQQNGLAPHTLSAMVKHESTVDTPSLKHAVTSHPTGESDCLQAEVMSKPSSSVSVMNLNWLIG